MPRFHSGASIGDAPGGSASGDLGGTYPSPTVAKSSTSTWGAYNVTAVSKQVLNQAIDDLQLQGHLQ